MAGNKSIWLYVICVSFLHCVAGQTFGRRSSNKKNQPNIVIVMTDDQDLQLGEFDICYFIIYFVVCKIFHHISLALIVICV